MKKNRSCRVCGNRLYKEPLLNLKNMPKAAQSLPNGRTLGKDRGVNLSICQCSGCGLVQLDCPPVPYFRQVVRASAFSPEMMGFRQRQFKKFVNKYSLRGKKVVEIGCGRGEYLSILKETGVDASGLEYSAGSVAQCGQAGLKATKGFVGDSAYQIKHAPFAAFFMLSFLEHLPDPNSALRGIYNNLEEDGVGLVEVPNFDMITKKELFSEFIGDHLMYFTKATLATALQLKGFDVVECAPVWHDYIISATVKKRIKLDLSNFGASQERLKAEIDRFIGPAGQKRVAVWGAGHQALALISLLGLASKIRYVVDSAPFKQGKFTPATHVPIVSPQALVADPVDAVIIMAASYSDEVAGLIKKRYGAIKQLATIRECGLVVRR